MALLRRPAHAGLEPRAAQWQLSSRLEELEIGVFFASDIQGRLLKKVDAQPQELVGYYRVTGSENAFVKLLWNKDADSHFAAERIAGWLQGFGVKTNKVRAGYPKPLPARAAQIFIYDYIEHEFAASDPVQLGLIGEGLGKMHSHLHDYPEKANVEVKGRAKNAMLRGQLERIHQGYWRCEVNPVVTGILLETKLADFDLMEEQAQMIHGDMNYGNVLVDRVSGLPVFIDFEDAVTSWLSPLYDLVFVIQRFIFTRDHKASGVTVETLLSAFIQGYRRSWQLPATTRADAMFVIYRMISVRALLLLSLLSGNEQATYRDEYEKFVWLYQDSESRVTLLEDAYAALLA